MNDKEAAPNARVNAADSLLDRGWGKPTQTVATDPDNPFRVELVKRVIVDSDDTDA